MTLPRDVQEAIDRYDYRVLNGILKPWDPDEDMQVPEHEEWLRDWLDSRIPLDY